MKRITLKPGQVYVTRSQGTDTPSRRIVHVDITEVDTLIAYSTGGADLRYCKRRAFRAWIRKFNAKATRNRRPRSLTLTPPIAVSEETAMRTATTETESVRRCRGCGCTQDRACPGGCYWVEWDLCSACQTLDIDHSEGDQDGNRAPRPNS